MNTLIHKQTLYIIDGSSLLYRAFYGLSPMHTSEGVAVHALYGFCRAVKKIIDDFDPSFLVIVWDSPGKTTRKEIYEEYKATRQAAPNDLFAQKKLICEWASTVGISQVVYQGWEADDIIARLAREAVEKNVLIIGPDKDLHQLISSSIEMYDPMKKKRYTKIDIEQKYGFEVRKIPFYYALVGDSSDNIPGVRGVGPKMATILVQQFESIDDMYKHVDDIASASAKKKVLEDEKNARLSYELFLLGDPDVSVSEEEMAFDKKWWEKGYHFFIKNEFKSLVPEVMWQQKQQQIQPEKKGIATLVLEVEKLKKICEKICEIGFCAVDTETNGLLPLDEPLVGFSLAYSDQEAFYVPIRHQGEGSESQISFDTALGLIKPLMENESIKKVFHHAKFDMHVFDHVGIEVKGLYFDTLIAASLLRIGPDKIGLKALSERVLGEPMQTFLEVLQKQKSFDLVSFEEAGEYAARDALQTYKLWRVFESEFEEKKDLKKLFFELEIPVCEVLFGMEKVGILFDIEKITESKISVDKKIEQVTEKIIGFLESVGVESPELINLQAPRQIEKLLFDDLGLIPRGKSAKGARSTKQDVLEALSKEHPIPRLILQHRELMKLKTTYIEPLPQLVQVETGRIHTSYNQTGVITGRLSSNDPNMQNIPVSHEEGIGIRRAFIAAPGKTFISADYSQIELRVLAHMTQDEHLLEAFLHDQDIHAKTASQIFHVSDDEVTDEQRQIGKRINFSIMYGMTPFGLSKDLGISMKDARSYIDVYFEQYQGVAQWMKDVVEEAKIKGYVTTMWKRRRYVPELQERNKMIFESGRRVAVNTPIQGTSSELIKWAMCSIDQYLSAHPGYGSLLLQIHDEVIIEVDDKYINVVSSRVKAIMEQIVLWTIPLKVSIRTGKDWSEVTK